MKRNKLHFLVIAGLLSALFVPESECLKATSLIFGKTTTTTTTTTSAPEQNESASVSETPAPAAESNSSKPVLTGIPQIDYIWDPNLPRELNGYNLTDYPFYSSVPPPEEMAFKCDGLHDGFYASVPHKCQVYHHCLYGTRYDFLCANFTAFDQKTFICHFASEVDCDNSPKYYHRNDALYEATTTTTTTTTTVKPPVTQPPPPAVRPGGGRRRRPSYRPRRPQYDYYDEVEEYGDQYYYDEEPVRSRRRKRPRPRRPPSDFDDFEDDYDERFDRRGYEDRRRPENRRKPEDDRLSSDEDRRMPEDSRRRPSDDDRMGPEEDRRRPSDERRRPESDRRRPDKDRRRPDDDRRSFEERRRPADDRKRKPVDMDKDDRDVYEDEYERRPLYDRKKPPYNRRPSDERRNMNRRPNDERRGYNEDRRDTDERRPLKEYDDYDRPIPKRKNSDEDEGRRYRPTGTDSYSPNLEVTVKPSSSSSIYSKPRAPPRIRRPVPINERDKFDYTSTKGPKASRVSVKDEYYDDEYEDEPLPPKPRQQQHNKPVSESRKPDVPNYETRKPVDITDYDSSEDLSSTSKYSRGRRPAVETTENVYRTSSQKPIQSRQNFRQNRRPSSPYSPKKNLEPIIDEPIREDIIEELKPSPKRNTNNFKYNDRRTQKPDTEEIIPYEDTIKPSRSHQKPTKIPDIEAPYEDRTKPSESYWKRPSTSTTRPTASSSKPIQDQPYEDEYYYDDEEYDTVISSHPADTPTNKNKYSPPAQTESTTVRQIDNTPKTVVKVVKRPFLPSRGGNPLASRGLQPVGSRALEVNPTTRRPVAGISTTLSPSSDEYINDDDDYYTSVENEEQETTKLQTTNTRNQQQQRYNIKNNFNTESNQNQKPESNNYRGSQTYTSAKQTPVSSFSINSGGLVKDKSVDNNNNNYQKASDFRPSPGFQSDPFKGETRPISTTLRPVQTQNEQIESLRNPLDINENEYDVTLNDALNPTIPNIVRHSPVGFQNYNGYQRQRYVSFDPLSAASSNIAYQVHEAPSDWIGQFVERYLNEE